jgi:hypothetical protein
MQFASLVHVHKPTIPTDRPPFVAWPARRNPHGR